MGAPSGFAWKPGKTGNEVLITHHGRKATVLRGVRATAFLAEVTDMSIDEQQAAMARATGNYKRGNERVARNHPRNRQ